MGNKFLCLIFEATPVGGGNCGNLYHFCFWMAAGFELDYGTCSFFADTAVNYQSSSDIRNTGIFMNVTANEQTWLTLRYYLLQSMASRREFAQDGIQRTSGGRMSNQYRILFN